MGIRSIIVAMFRFICWPCRRLWRKRTKEPDILPFTNESSYVQIENYTSTNGSEASTVGWQDWDNRLSTAIEDKIQQYREQKMREKEIQEQQDKLKRDKEMNDRKLFEQIEPTQIQSNKKGPASSELGILEDDEPQGSQWNDGEDEIDVDSALKEARKIQRERRMNERKHKTSASTQQRTSFTSVDFG